MFEELPQKLELHADNFIHMNMETCAEPDTEYVEFSSRSFSEYNPLCLRFSCGTLLYFPEIHQTEIKCVLSNSSHKVDLTRSVLYTFT